MNCNPKLELHNIRVLLSRGTPESTENAYNKVTELLYDLSQPEDKKLEPALDVQIGGDHYKRFKIQPVEFITKNNMGFCEGNVIKYITRYEFKNGIEDLKKVKHYVDLLIELKYGDHNEPAKEKTGTSDK